MKKKTRKTRGVPSDVLIRALREQLRITQGQMDSARKEREAAASHASYTSQLTNERHASELLRVEIRLLREAMKLQAAAVQDKLVAVEKLNTSFLDRMKFGVNVVGWPDPTKKA